MTCLEHGKTAAPTVIAETARAARVALQRFEHDVLGAVPQHVLAERTQLIAAFDHGQKMTAGELADLAGKMHAAIGEQNLGLADAAGIEDDLARRRIAGVILEAQ